MSTVCKTCGGPVNRVGNYYVCEYCRNKWEIDSSNDVHAVDRANAWAALRDGDFEKAAELFENIIAKEPKNHEAYWGRALALGGIVYVTDMNENKKVPTCNNITEESFIKNKDVQKAISLAPSDIADGYKQQAQYIETVRIEWLEKASKEPAYDVFISFKDSDRENGIERTQDSIDAQDLYNALVAEGYKVFFSRISLRNKISEQYEPYIYNAIKTAKAMIVFGEKAKYFNAVWVKNEWSRFKTRIEKGEKHKNSLVVVYKNMNPGDLPVVLKSRQCLNASDMTFLSDLNRHIKRVVEESKRSVHLEKIEIAGGQISKKAAALAVNAVQTREIGQGALAETSISEKQSISLIYTYLQEKQWADAGKLAEDVLFDNPSCAEAIWCKLLSDYEAEDDQAFVKKLNNLGQPDYDSIDKLLNCASKEYAEEILSLLYASEEHVGEKTYKKILDTILPFAFSKRDSKIKEAVNGVIERSKFEPFMLLLNTLNSSDVDLYISYNYKYATTTLDMSEIRVCLNNILKVDEGNIDALRLVMLMDILPKRTLGNLTADFEKLLKYTKDVDSEVTTFLDLLCSELTVPTHCAFAKQLLRYYTGEIVSLKDRLMNLSYRIIEQGLFAEAEYFLNLVLSFDANQPEAYWAICLMKIEAKTEYDVVKAEKLLRDVPEFNKYLTLVDEDRRTHCIALSGKQRVKNESAAVERNSPSRKQNILPVTKTLRKLLNRAKVLRLNKSEEKEEGQVLVKEHRIREKQKRQAIIDDRKKEIAGIKEKIVGTEKLLSEAQKIYDENSGKIFGAGAKLKKTAKKDIKKYEAQLAEHQSCLSRTEQMVSLESGRLKSEAIKKLCSNTKLAIKQDGTLLVRDDKLQKLIEEWYGIVTVSEGAFHYLGLKADGTVVATGANRSGGCNVEQWRDVVAVSAGTGISLGLRFDGTVAIASNKSSIERGVKQWRDIDAVSAGWDHSVGLKCDGTVVAAGDNDYGQCNVEQWRDVVAVSAGWWHSVGLKCDGTVVATGDNKYGQCNVEQWRDVVDIFASGHHTIGLRRDGTVVATGENKYGQCNVEQWRDVVAVFSDSVTSYGIKSDGTIVCTFVGESGNPLVIDWKLFDNINDII